MQRSTSRTIVTSLLACSIGSAAMAVTPRVRADDNNRPPGGGFSALDPSWTGLNMDTSLRPDHPMSRLYVTGYVSGGIAVGDIDSDDLPDLVFTSGRVGIRLYLQLGDLRFEDRTVEAGLAGSAAWSNGAALADIDNDGDLDLYVCNYDAPNGLYLNDGTGRFVEAAARFGLDVVDACMTPAFCDYDRDGDLDLLVLTNRYYRQGGRPKALPVGVRGGKPYVLEKFRKYYALKKRGGRFGIDNVGRRNLLFRNEGEGRFTEVGVVSGLKAPGHGLSATWWDYDRDGWPDLYVANDFDDPDHLYRNNRDGTFTDVIAEACPHTSWFSMGADFGDLNRDGRFDLLVADMSSTTHYGQKTTMGAMNAEKLAKVAGPPPQLMKNALFIGSGTDRFYETAELAGLADTDWSWSVEIEDFDNDGFEDVFITNGMVRSINNSDLAIDTGELIGRTEWDIYRDSPERPERNAAFRNLGDLRFEGVGPSWNLDDVSMSFAAARGDLDRDGDIDLVIMNVNKPVAVYRNDAAIGSYLAVSLRGRASNRFGLGAVATLESESGTQVRMLSPYTGFLSSDNPALHFGLGSDRRVESLTVEWPSGARQVLRDLPANQFLTIEERDDRVSPAEPGVITPALFEGVTVNARHRELPFNDFDHQPLLPNKLSQLGPGLAVADCNGDGIDDFFLSGSSGQAGQVFFGTAEGRFEPIEQPALDADRLAEDMGAVWIDFDGDDDQDLYVASGGVEFPPGGKTYRDRLYLNDGTGHLTPASRGTLPDSRSSSGAVAAADFDRDGDIDLVVGSRVEPWDYPNAGPTRLLRNESGRFEDVTNQIAADLVEAGMVTGALWSDADGDGWLDLLLTTEWGPVRFFENEEGGRLTERTHDAGLAPYTGWWNGIDGRDVDGDGDIDYVATNFGLNTKYHASAEEPALLYAGDFSGDGECRLIEAELESGRLVPIRGKSCSSLAMPHLNEHFHTFHDFASASLPEIYSNDRLDSSRRLAATTLESCLLLNEGLRFEVRPLPRMAQVSPSFGVLLTEMNGDGIPDIYLAQNFFQAQPETGRMDGGMGLLLMGIGDAAFLPVDPAESGLVVTGDATASARVALGRHRRDALLVGVNADRIRAFRRNDTERDARLFCVRLESSRGNRHACGARVTVLTDNGQEQTAELYAGSGYLSQSTASLLFGVPSGARVEEVIVRWPDGGVSRHTPSPGADILISQP